MKPIIISILILALLTLVLFGVNQLLLRKEEPPLPTVAETTHTVAGPTVITPVAVETPTTPVETGSPTTSDKNLVIPGLRLVKKGPQSVFLNKTAEYKITVFNYSDMVMKDMVLVDHLPSQLKFLLAEPFASSFQKSKTRDLIPQWNLGDIQPGQAVSFLLTARAAEGGVTCRNTATVYSNAPEFSSLQPLEAFCDTAIYGMTLSLPISCYDTEDPLEIGQQTVYVLEVRNEGSTPCSEVVVESYLSDELQFVRAEGPTKYTNEGNHIIFQPIPLLPSAEKVIYKITARAMKAGPAKQKAILRCKEFNRDIICEEGTTCFQ